MSQNQKTLPNLTKKYSCVIKTHASSLECTFIKSSFDETIENNLFAASREFQAWSDELIEQTISAISKDHTKRFSEILKTFVDDINDLSRALNLQQPLEQAFHDDWRQENDISELVRYAHYIEGFVFPKTLTDFDLTIRDYLESFPENSSTDQVNLPQNPRTLEREILHQKYNRAKATKEILVSALKQYEIHFASYIKHIEDIYPGLTNYANFCRDYSGAYGDACLDYSIAPGNRCIVDYVNEFYCAQVLESEYETLESSADIIAYSHRLRGFNTYVFELNTKRDLKIAIETNFGYGRKSYFTTRLSYMGISLINSFFLLFFEGGNYQKLLSYTNIFEVKERSFVDCFDSSVSVFNDYQMLSEDAFMDKYFTKQVELLCQLLELATKSNISISILTIEALNGLTGLSQGSYIESSAYQYEAQYNNVGKKTELEEFFSRGEHLRFKLTDAEETIVNNLCSVVLEILEQGDDTAKQEKFNNIIQKEFKQGFHNNSSLIQESIVLELISDRLIRLCKEQSKKPLWKINKTINEYLPKPPVRVYRPKNEFDKIAFQIKLCNKARPLLLNLKNSTLFPRLKQNLSKIFDLFLHVSNTSREYLNSTIYPAIKNQETSVLQLDNALRELESKKDPQNYASSIDWLDQQISSTKQKCNSLKKQLFQLRQQKNQLESFCRNTDVLVDSASSH